MFNPAAARARCEAATPMQFQVTALTENRYNVQDGRGYIAAKDVRYEDAWFFAHARSDLLAALEALEEAQACSACNAIHYLHPNAKRGDFSGPMHAKVGSTCGRCGEMWPCDVTELREGYARLQAALTEAGENLKVAARLAVQAQRERDGYKALAERRGKALPDPDKLRLLADWFDGDDAAKGRRGPSLATLGGQPPDEVRRELRGWADDIEAAIDATPEARGKEKRCG
jgi:hypothetical protein